MPSSTTASVLTAEDDPAARSDLRRMLERAGYAVCPDARDGIEVVDLARQYKPDLILIDVALPLLDGVEATRRILDERDVPIVALLHDGNDGHAEHATAAGAAAHVLKPVSESALVGTVSDVLAERATREEWNRRNLLVLIESLQRSGLSEHEITTAVNETSAAGARVRPRARRASRRGAFPWLDAVRD